MMKNNFFIVLFCIFYTFYNTANVFANKKPEWLTNSEKFCSNIDLCATGSGRNLNLAKIDARNNIQKIFETKIDAKFSNKISNRNNDIYENTQEEISEEISGVLNGIIIAKTYEENGIFYVLAVLNKEKTGGIIAREVNALDEKMVVLLEENTYNSSLEIEKLYSKRDKLNNNYLFLTGNSLKEVVSYKQVLENKRKKKDNATFFVLKVKDQYSSLEPIIKNILIENGLNITTTVDNNVKIINAGLTMNKDYINVDGFEKYKINLNIDIIKKGKTTGFIRMEFLETGRNKEQIYNKAIEKIKDYINENFDEFLN